MLPGGGGWQQRPARYPIRLVAGRVRWGAQSLVVRWFSRLFAACGATQNWIGWQEQGFRLAGASVEGEASAGLASGYRHERRRSPLEGRRATHEVQIWRQRQVALDAAGVSSSGTRAPPAGGLSPGAGNALAPAWSCVILATLAEQSLKGA
jgi:hypothetical protein